MLLDLQAFQQMFSKDQVMEQHNANISKYHGHSLREYLFHGDFSKITSWPKLF